MEQAMVSYDSFPHIIFLRRPLREPSRRRTIEDLPRHHAYHRKPMVFPACRKGASQTQQTDTDNTRNAIWNHGRSLRNARPSSRIVFRRDDRNERGIHGYCPDLFPYRKRDDDIVSCILRIPDHYRAHRLLLRHLRGNCRHHTRKLCIQKNVIAYSEKNHLCLYGYKRNYMSDKLNNDDNITNFKI